MSNAQETFVRACGLSKTRKCARLERGLGYRSIRPKTIAVYALLKEEKILYIGCTQNLRARMGGHAKKDFNQLIFIVFKNHFRAFSCETNAIHKIQPPLNKKGLEYLKELENNEAYEAMMTEKGFVMKWRKSGENSMIGTWFHSETGLPYHLYIEQYPDQPKETNQ